MFSRDSQSDRRPPLAVAAIIICCTMELVSSHILFAQTTGALTPIDLTRLEQGEEYPGGAATSRKSVTNSNAFSHASGNLNFKKELDFKVGNGIFKKIWVSSPASTDASDGLGPLFNARACQRCHLKDGRGHPPDQAVKNDRAISMLLRLSIPPQTEEHRRRLAALEINTIPDPNYGGQLQDFSVQGHPAEGKIRITYTEHEIRFPDGEIVKLRKPAYEITNLSYGALHKDIRISPRIAPQMIGLGLLEAIPEDTVRALADPEDADKDGISGKPNLVWSKMNKKVMIGRFGWKAGKPTVREQTAGAFAGDMGLSSTIETAHAGDCTKHQSKCQNAPHGDSSRYQNVEVGDQMLDLVTFYSQNLAVPKRRDASNPIVLSGKKLFHQSGCAKCHTPRVRTGKLKGQPHLSGQLIWPYTDLLLHDMGEGLADNSPEGVANGREWRTSPLWGIGLTRIVNGHTFFLHDGRARSIKEAILWHGGEAEKSRNTFMGLTKKERDNLIAFVNSL